MSSALTRIVCLGSPALHERVRAVFGDIEGEPADLGFCEDDPGERPYPMIALAREPVANVFCTLPPDAPTELVRALAERAHEQHALREAHARALELLERLRLIYDHAEDAIFSIDPDSRRFLDVNVPASRLTGWSRKELLRLGIDELRAAISPPSAREIFDEIMRDSAGTFVGIGATLTRQDQSTRFVDIHLVIIRHAGRRMIQCILRDATSRQMMRQTHTAAVTQLERDLVQTNLELQEASDRLETTLRSIGEGVVVTDAEARVALFNAAAERLLGVAEGEVVGRPLQAVVTDPRFAAGWEELIARQHGSAEIELQPGLVLSATHARFQSRTEREVGAVTILRDITRAKEIDRMKTEFISNVSHELKSPLTSIKGFLATILRDYGHMDDGTRREFLTIVKRESDRLADMIEDVLNVSRIDAGELKLQKSHVHLNEIVKELVDLVRVQFDTKGVALLYEDPGRVGPVSADRDRVHDVLQNLLSNGLKFTPPGGSVEILLAESSTEVILEVSDTGLGIPADDLGHVFERFFRSKAHEQSIRGTGLGLAITKHIVEQHGGQISLESRLGRGTSVTVTLPRERRA